MTQRLFRKAVKMTLVSVYIIFIAGAIVRMTGSGMGCPDWPKCFGYYIPPTKVSQILWHSKKSYRKGSIIVYQEKLYAAKKTFITGDDFNPLNWERYTKHDYAVFNVFHTWTEYLNRLSSIVSGFFFTWLLYCAFRYWHKNRVLTLWCLMAFLLMFFEAWMGKKVIDTVLRPKIITAHMVIGLFIIQILIGVLYKLSLPRLSNITFKSYFLILLWVALCCSLLQIVTGTQVRQFVDDQVAVWGFDSKEMRLYQPNIIFYFHRSFTILIIILNLWIFNISRKIQLPLKIPIYILLTIFIESFTGVLMYYIDFPMGTQAVHFVSGIVMFGLQSYLVWDYQAHKSRMLAINKNV